VISLNYSNNQIQEDREAEINGLQQPMSLRALSLLYCLTPSRWRSEQLDLL